MKNIILSMLTLVLGFSSLAIHAQRLVINEAVCTTDDANQAGIEVIMEPKTKTIKKAIKDWMDDNYDVKLKGLGLFSNKDVLTADQVQIDAISTKQMDLKVQVVKDGNNSKMCVFGSFGYDFPVSPTHYPVAYRQMRGLTLDFLDEFLPNWYLNRIEETQEVVGDLGKERKKLAEDIEKNKEEIEELREENEEKSETLAETASDLEKAAATLEQRKAKLEEVNKKLEKQKKKNKLF